MNLRVIRKLALIFESGDVIKQFQFPELLPEVTRTTSTDDFGVKSLDDDCAFCTCTPRQGSVVGHMVMAAVQMDNIIRPCLSLSSMGCHCKIGYHPDLLPLHRLLEITWEDTFYSPLASHKWHHIVW